VRSTLGRPVMGAPLPTAHENRAVLHSPRSDGQTLACVYCDDEASRPPRRDRGVTATAWLPHGERCFRNQMGGLFATDYWVLHKTKTPALWSDAYFDLKVKI
jgi:hypothetical protein